MIESSRSQPFVPSDRYFALRRKGETHLDSRRYKQAEEAFDKCLEIRPTDPTVMLRLATVYNETGRHSEALVLADRALRIQPQSAPAQIAKARALRRLGQWEKAAQVYREVLASSKARNLHGVVSLDLARLLSERRAVIEAYSVLKSSPPRTLNDNRTQAKLRELERALPGRVSALVHTLRRVVAAKRRLFDDQERALMLAAELPAAIGSEAAALARDQRDGM